MDDVSSFTGTGTSFSKSTKGGSDNAIVGALRVWWTLMKAGREREGRNDQRVDEVDARKT